MFIYLSKILPLLVYPLGLASLLMIGLIGVDIWTRAWSWRTTVYTVVFLVLAVGGNHYVAHWITHSLERVYQPLPAGSTADVIVVLGGGTHPVLPPRQHPEVREEGDRLLYASQLYRAGAAEQILVTGGRIEWLGGRDLETEANDMTIILGMLGVPEEAIWQEGLSQNTYENALYTRDILAEKEITRIILVTSAYHMPRSVAIFEKQGFEVVPAPADFFVTETERTAGESAEDLATAIFYMLPQSEYLDRTTKALKEYIGMGVYWMRGWL